MLKQYVTVLILKYFKFIVRFLFGLTDVEKKNVDMCENVLLNAVKLSIILKI